MHTRFLSEKKTQDIHEARQKVEKEYQRQAVSNNFAHWEVNVNGEVTFKWNTNKGAL